MIHQSGGVFLPPTVFTAQAGISRDDRSHEAGPGSSQIHDEVGEVCVVSVFSGAESRNIIGVGSWLSRRFAPSPPVCQWSSDWRGTPVDIGLARGHDGSLALSSSQHRQTRVHWDVHWGQQTFLSLSGPLGDFYQGKKKVPFPDRKLGKVGCISFIWDKRSGSRKGPDVFWCKLNYSFPKIIPELT